MSFQNKYELCLASEKDGDAINEVFDSESFDGNICVNFARKPNPYDSLQSEGDKAVIGLLKIKETREVISVGACVIRKAFVNGAVKNVGYLTGLKLKPEYQKRVNGMPESYQFMHQLTKDEVSLYYTTILKDNVTVQKMLEKKRKNMPQYIYQGDYTVYCIKTGGRKRNMNVTRGLTPALLEFYKKNLPKRDLSPADIKLHGLKDNDFLAYYGDKGEILAACAIWNRQAEKQYVVTAYNGVYKCLSKLPAELFGYPPLPKINVPANYASLSLLSVSDMKAAGQFIRKVSEMSGEYDFLMIGLYENDPLNDILKNMKSIKYQSRLYLVDFGDVPSIDKSGVYLDVGLL